MSSMGPTGAQKSAPGPIFQDTVVKSKASIALFFLDDFFQ